MNNLENIAADFGGQAQMSVGDSRKNCSGVRPKTILVFVMPLTGNGETPLRKSLLSINPERRCPMRLIQMKKTNFGHYFRDAHAYSSPMGVPRVL